MSNQFSRRPLWAAIFCLSGWSLPFASHAQQTTVEKALVHRIESVRRIEANGWIVIDTIYRYNPETYEEQVSYEKINLAPLKIDDGEPIYLLAEQTAAFPGGASALQQFLEANVHIPVSYQADGYQVGVEFVVEKDGTLTYMVPEYYQSTRRPAHILEALRVAAAMPKWTPARHRGQAVRSFATISVRF